EVNAVRGVQPEVAALEGARVDRTQVPGEELVSGLEELVPVAPYDGIRVRGHDQASEPTELHEAGDRERREAQRCTGRPPRLGGEPGAGHLCRQADGAAEAAVRASLMLASVPPGKFAARSRAVSRRLASLLLLAIASAIPRRPASPGAPIPPDLALRISRAGH